MVILNWIRYVLYLAVIIILFFIINVGFIAFTTWAIGVGFSIYNWSWWKIILLGLFGLVFLRFLWSLFRTLAALLITLAGHISPFKVVNAYTVAAIAIINGILILYSIWSADGDRLLFIDILTSVLTLQLTYAFFIGGVGQLNQKDDYENKY